MNNADNFLDVKPDLNLDSGRYSYWLDELYSDKQLVKKVEKILTLSNEAVKTITKDIIPVLGKVRPTYRKIGIVHRKDRFSGVSYIRVKVDEDEETTPIIEFREEDIETYPKLDSYYVEKLKMCLKNCQESYKYNSKSTIEKY